MSQLSVPSQTWSGTRDFGPVAKPAGASLVSIQPTAPTDWQTGTAGRTVTATIQISTDGGATWRDKVSNQGDPIATPQMGKAGAFPTIIQADVATDPANAE